MSHKHTRRNLYLTHPQVYLLNIYFEGRYWIGTEMLQTKFGWLTCKFQYNIALISQVLPLHPYIQIERASQVEIFRNIRPCHTRQITLICRQIKLSRSITHPSCSLHLT